MTIRKWLIALGIFIFGIFIGLAVSCFTSKEKPKNDVLSTTNQQESQNQPASSQNQSSQEASSFFGVIKIIDGDTVVLESGETVRLIGIDSPEKNECFAGEATAAMKNLVEGKRVRLEKDVSETDKYRRLLRFIYADTTFVNDYLVRQGFARAAAYQPDLKFKDQFGEAQAEAKENNRGLWRACQDETKPGLSGEYKPGLSGGLIEDKDCKDFKTHQEAQAFFESQGPQDPHKLDSDGDGLACESLP